MGTNIERDRALLSDPLPKAFTDAKANEERNGRRRRRRETERVAVAVEAVVRALEPLSAEARGRVMRAAATLLDVELAVLGERFAGG